MKNYSRIRRSKSPLARVALQEFTPPTNTERAGRQVTGGAGPRDCVRAIARVSRRLRKPAARENDRVSKLTRQTAAARALFSPNRDHMRRQLSPAADMASDRLW